MRARRGRSSGRPCCWPSACAQIGPATTSHGWMLATGPLSPGSFSPRSPWNRPTGGRPGDHHHGNR
eukprot:10693688-Lingulodinium_polyedra.AAC.1